MYPANSISSRGGLDLQSEEEKAVQVLPPVTHNISAQTFTFRELAAATRNFRPECFIGEGGFGPVYKGRIESTGQVRNLILINHNISWFLPF